MLCISHVRREKNQGGPHVSMYAAEPLMDGKSQWQGHRKESRRPKASSGNGRGKRYSRDSLWTANHNSRDTQGELATEGVRAPYGLQIKMAGTHKGDPATEATLYLPVAHGFRRTAIWSPIAFHLDWRQPRQEQQQSPFWTANHNGRDTERRAGDRRRQPATAAARTTAEPLMDGKSQWQGHRKESRRTKVSTGDSRGGKNNSRAPYGLQITMAETRKGEPATEGVNRR